MGTRSLTVVENEDGAEIVVMYRQYDGYPSGHGAALAQFLDGKHLVNGFSSGMTLEDGWNGSGCLTAALVAAFKTEVGGIYLYPAGTRDAGEEWIYTIRTRRTSGALLAQAIPTVTVRDVYGDKEYPSIAAAIAAESA